MSYIFYGALTIGAVVAIVSSLACIFISRIGKNNEPVKFKLIALFVGVSILFLLYFAGNYRKLNLNTEIKERLLSINDIKTDKQEITINGTDVEITVGNDCVESYKDFSYYDYYAEIFEQRLSDSDTYVLIMPARADRCFDKIPHITEYENTVVVITENKSLTISFLAEKENSSEILKYILDVLFGRGVII